MLRRLTITFAALFATAAFADGHGDHPAYSNVTQARLLSPEPQNWLMYRRTYDSQGYSPLKQITRRNGDERVLR